MSYILVLEQHAFTIDLLPPYKKSKAIIKLLKNLPMVGTQGD